VCTPLRSAAPFGIEAARPRSGWTIRAQLR
jgi:hypothetical protein